MTEQVQNLPEGHEKDVHYSGIIVGIPTFGKMSAAFHLSEKMMQMPIFCNAGVHTVQGKPVDVARNEIAWMAMQSNQGFVFFRDDDVIAPTDSLIKLLERIPHAEKANPKECKRVIGGVVYSKAQPPVPMLHIEGHTAAFEDWEPGDLVSCDAIGMGCTLIPVGAFYALLPHLTEFRCANPACPEPWGAYKKPKEGAWEQKCPNCGSFLFPGFFKTVRASHHCGDIRPGLVTTEDSYFCILLKEKAGGSVYCDTGVLAEHEVFNADPAQCVYYGYYHGIGPGWRIGQNVFFYPDAENEAHSVSMASLSNTLVQKKVGDSLRFNIGCGGVNFDDFVNIDLNSTVNADFYCDAKNLKPALEKYGKPVEIRALHLLEHFERAEIIGVIRHWIKCLAPGGLLDIEVPDGVWAMKEAIRVAENDGNVDEFPEMIVFGANRYGGDEHRCILYEKKLEKMMEACKEQIEEYTITAYERGEPRLEGGKYNQRVVRLKITKKGVVVEKKSDTCVPVGDGVCCDGDESSVREG